MSSLLEQVVEDLRSLSREEQDRAAAVLLVFLEFVRALEAGETGSNSALRQVLSSLST